MSSDALPITPARFAEAIQSLPISSLHLKVLELRNSIAHLDYSNEELRPFAEGRAKPLAVQDHPTTTTTAAAAQQEEAAPSSAVSAEAQRGGGGGGAAAAGTQPPPTEGLVAEPDQDCIDAIRENEAVISRMEERIRLIRAEVESRGRSWDEFRSAEEVAERRAADANANADADADAGTADSGSAAAAPAATNGHATGQGDPWADGTFQTGVIRDGEVVMDVPSGAPSSRPPRQPGGSLADEELRRRVEEQMRNLGTDGNDGGDGDDGGMHL